MSGSREESPDWLRSFQPPTQSAIELSSGSESPVDHILVSDDEDGINLTKLFKKETTEASDTNYASDGSEAVANELIKGKSPKKNEKEKQMPKGKRKNEDDNKRQGKKAKRQDGSINAKNDSNDNFVKEDLSWKHSGSQVSSSRVPLLLPEKVQRSKALIECDGDSIDLSGDVGAVGRIVISEDSFKNPEMFLDLKGTIYKTTIVPSRTFCVVSFGQSEAKIEAIMNDYVQLKPQSNVYEAETMVEGTLDGFSFDSEDEADKATAQADQNEEPDAENTRKPGKATGAGRRKGKPTGGKPAKKVKKKPQVSKKGKSKK